MPSENEKRIFLPEPVKVTLGLAACVISGAFLFNYLNQSPMLTGFQAGMTTCVIIGLALFLSASAGIHAAAINKPYWDQTKGVWLLKGAMYLAGIVLLVSTDII